MKKVKILPRNYTENNRIATYKSMKTSKAPSYGW